MIGEETGTGKIAFKKELKTGSESGACYSPCWWYVVCPLPHGVPWALVD